MHCVQFQGRFETILVGIDDKHEEDDDYFKVMPYDCYRFRVLELEKKDEKNAVIKSYTGWVYIGIRISRETAKCVWENMGLGLLFFLLPEDTNFVVVNGGAVLPLSENDTIIV